MILVQAAPEELDTPNVQLTDELIAEALEKRKEDRAVVFSVGIVSFDVSLLDALKKTFKVSVLLCGIPVGGIELDANHVEQTIGPNIGFAKATITLGVNWGEDRITYAVRACVRNFLAKWKCASHSGTLTSW